MRLPRKTKKQVKGGKCGYDLAGLPKGMTIQRVIEIYKTTGVLVYDSSTHAGQDVSPTIAFRGQYARVRIKDLSK